MLLSLWFTHAALMNWCSAKKSDILHKNSCFEVVQYSFRKWFHISLFSHSITVCNIWLVSQYLYVIGCYSRCASNFITELHSQQFLLNYSRLWQDDWSGMILKKSVHEIFFTPSVTPRGASDQDTRTSSQFFYAYSSFEWVEWPLNRQYSKSFVTNW